MDIDNENNNNEKDLKIPQELRKENSNLNESNKNIKKNNDEEKKDKQNNDENKKENPETIKNKEDKNIESTKYIEIEQIIDEIFNDRENRNFAIEIIIKIIKKKILTMISK